MDDTTTQQQGAAAPTGRRGRRAARRAAKVAVTTAAGVHGARRGRRVLRGLFRLGRAGVLLGAAAGAVWWLVQRRSTRDAYLQGPAEPAVPVGGDGGDGATGTGTGTGASGGVPPAGGDDLVDITGAARLLEVDESRIPVMVEGGLIEPVGTAGDLRFRVAELQAVRLQGG